MNRCYIITCAACGLLHEVSRRGALTCSTSCRVWLHRHPEVLVELRAHCETFEIEVFALLEASATRILRPDLSERMLAGEIELEDVRVDIRRAFMDRLEAAVKAMVADET